MKYLIIIFSFLLFTNTISAQELITRELKIIANDLAVDRADGIKEVTINTVKYNADGSIKKLYQVTEGYKTTGSDIQYHQENLLYELIEDYKQNKRWFVYNIKYVRTETLSKKGKTIIKYKAFMDGKLQLFNEDGTISYLSNYTNDIEDEIRYKYEYYPDGKIKLILEMKNEQPWNVMDYRFPDGQKFDNYGDFENGEGIIAFLNDEGEPCLDCTFTYKHEAIGDWKCDE